MWLAEQYCIEFRYFGRVVLTNHDVPSWREDLPENCPPAEAAPLNNLKLMRLVGPHDVVESDFASHAALGYTCHMEDKECEWASCSMFLPSLAPHQLRDLRKFKRLKSKTSIVYVQVHSSAGVAVIKPTRHVDMWFYDSFSPTQAIVATVPLDEYVPA